jgi:hypothetical protein
VCREDHNSDYGKMLDRRGCPSAIRSDPDVSRPAVDRVISDVASPGRSQNFPEFVSGKINL